MGPPQVQLKHLLWFSPVLVLLNSLLGLWRVIDLFADVWTASLIGDIMFVGGTVGVVVLAWRIIQEPKPRRWWAVPAVFAADWFVYALAWSFTGTVMFEEPTVMWFGFVMQWGFPGILAFTAATAVWVAASNRVVVADGTGAEPADDD